MAREEAERLGNMAEIAKRRENVFNFLDASRRREERRRQNNLGAVANTVTGNQQALRNMIFRTGANTSRAAQTALAPLELLDPRNLVQFWSNYGDFVANRQFTQGRGKHAGRRR